MAISPASATATKPFNIRPGRAKKINVQELTAKKLFTSKLEVKSVGSELLLLAIFFNRHRGVSRGQALCLSMALFTHSKHCYGVRSLNKDRKDDRNCSCKGKQETSWNEIGGVSPYLNQHIKMYIQVLQMGLTQSPPLPPQVHVV